MTKLVRCKTCNAEVAKSAKSCPHCGQKLKMGFLPKLVIAIVVLIALAIFSLPSEEEVADQLAAIEAAEPAQISPGGEVAEMFNLGSENTDVQRDNMEERLTGQIVKWTLPVYEVSVENKERRVYKVQTVLSDKLEPVSGLRKCPSLTGT